MSLPTGQASAIKAQILVNLNALATAGILGAVIEQDITADVMKLNFSGFPCAVLGSSSLQAAWEYQQANKRTYQYDLLIVQLVDNLPSPTYMEDLRDAIATQFDNNVTLNGTAVLGVQAVFSPKIQTSEQGKKYVTFFVTLKCITLANLTYSF